MRVIKHLIAALGFQLLAMAANAGDIEYVPVSIGGYNAFTFGTPFESAVFPPKSPIKGRPIPLGGNTTLLLEIDPEAKGDIQMTVNMRDGRVVQLRLNPGVDHAPANWHDKGAAAKDKRPIQRQPDEWFYNIYKHLVVKPSEPPEGFHTVDIPGYPVTKVSDLTAEYLHAYAQGPWRIYVMRLHSERPSGILPQDLYAPGVKSVLIDGDQVGGGYSPLTIVIMSGEL